MPTGEGLAHLSTKPHQNAIMPRRPDPVEMQSIAAEWLEGAGDRPESGAEAAALLEALGVPDLLHDLAIAKRVVVAADGFHPVARFFAQGSDEHEFIVAVLRRTTQRDNETTR